MKQQSKTIVENLLAKFPSKEIAYIEIDGHTDSDGSDNYNIQLSQNRVASVQQYLVSKGILGSKIKKEYAGEAQPMATNGNEDGKQSNRRVQIILHYKGKNTTKVSTLKIKEGVQTFTISPQKPMVIKGRKGTVIKFFENSFVDKNKELITTPITIELIEIYSKLDMINNNIATVSNGKLLETGGMIYLKATSQNSEVFLNSYYEIKFLTTKKMENMQLFRGDTLDNTINWQEVRTDLNIGNVAIELPNRMYQYLLKDTRFGWINCDRFIDAPEVTNLYIEISSLFNTNNSMFEPFLVFKNLNSVMKSSTRDKLQFNNVPVGEVVTIIASTYQDGKQYFGSKTVAIKRNKDYKITLEAITDQELQAKIKALNISR